MAVDGVIETRALDHRTADDNARRHAGLHAIYDWLYGQDPRWLVCGHSQNAYFSHDHGHYFPGGPDWTVESLKQFVALPMPLGAAGADATGLDLAELRRLADPLDRVTAEDLLSIVSTIPCTWPVSDDELKALVCFLLIRAPMTAARLRNMSH
jgi:hypothetical protein